MNPRAMGIETGAPCADVESGDFPIGLPPVRRRKLLVGAAGAIALLAGVLAQFWPSANLDRDVAGVAVHARPRELPPLRFSSETGTPLDLKAFGGRAVLLNIWATWCGPCREEMPTLDRLQALLGSPRFEVVALSIDGDGLASVKPFFAQIGVRSLRTYLDSFHDAGAIVGAGVPLTLLIDAQGREVARKLGAARWDDPAIVGLIRQYLPPIAGAREKAA